MVENIDYIQKRISDIENENQMLRKRIEMINSLAREGRALGSRSGALLKIINLSNTKSKTEKSKK